MAPPRRQERLSSAATLVTTELTPLRGPAYYAQILPPPWWVGRSRPAADQLAAFRAPIGEANEALASRRWPRRIITRGPTSRRAEN